MITIYDSDTIEEKIDESQKLLNERAEFKPDKVDVLESALDAYISELETNDGSK